ncbi:hypothetical protein NLI96_g7816 [Meripilus lineatus]|uniref:Uncharacterized protein n=1 Tax=Meripilus lineatus TaxID=2056292 RepID=A0AAD5V021_9APHY|nr:hypothetical protein NLI96_g7816 [Physisporinus lineatus]
MSPSSADPVNDELNDYDQGRDKPLPYRHIKTHRPFGKTSLLVFLVLVHVACNIAIIVASLHTFRLGGLIVQDFIPVSDNRALTVINILAKVLSISSVVIGGWAASHLWSRRLSKPGSSAGLAELQSLTIFQSVPTIYHSIRHLAAGRYISARWLYGVVIMCAILLQVYSIAVSTLMTPTLTETTQTRNQQIVPGAYFSQITNCDRNASGCLDIALSAKSLSDAIAFNRRPFLWGANATTPWLEADSTYYTPGLIIQAAFPVGPINGENLSDGGALWGVDLPTVLSITTIPDRLFLPASRSIWDAISFVITFSVQIPSIQCLCGHGSNNVTHIAIHNSQYTLATPIAFDTGSGGEIAGRLTDDNNTLILAYSSTQPSNFSITYCAVQLRSKEMPLLMWGKPSLSTLVDDTLIVSLDSSDTSLFSSRIPRDADTPPLPLPAFMTHWLHGLGWDDLPVTSPIVGILQQSTIGTGFDVSSQPPELFVEHFILVMIANGISFSFSDLFPRDSIQASSLANPPQNASIQFRIDKTQYFIGAKTAFQRFFLFVVFLDSVFVSLSCIIIVCDGWYPDLKDPVTLAQVALSSSPPGIPASPDVHAYPSNDVGLAQSPISLQHGPKKVVDPLLWKEKLSLVESVEGDFLLFRAQTSGGK